MTDLESALISSNTQLWKEPNGGLARENALVARVQAGELLRIMGPCALQSVAQIEAILGEVSPNVDAIRAPGKKPRTRPVSPSGEKLFEGIGLDETLRIFTTIISECPQTVFASETMSGQDLVTLGNKIGLAWIGSRTQQQETCRDIGEAAQQEQTPVMIKNPMSADLDLYMGMIENTILGSNNAVPLLLCLRGTVPVNAEQKANWRNVPNLEWLPILMKAFPSLPILVDPSHMLLKNKLNPESVGEIVHQAVDNGAKGYIIEVNTPDHPSLTDPGVNATEMMNVLQKKDLI